MRLLPNLRRAQPSQTAASGRWSHRRTGWTLWRDRRPDAFHMGRRTPVQNQAAAPAKADWSRKLARPLALDNGMKLTTLVDARTVLLDVSVNARSGALDHAIRFLPLAAETAIGKRDRAGEIALEVPARRRDGITMRKQSVA